MSSKKDYRIWTAVENGPGIQATPEAVYLVGNKSNFVAANKSCVAIVGKSVVMGTTGENIRQGGLFVNMNDFIRMIPSTVVTPIPPQIPMPPMAMISSVMKDLPFFLAMMAGAITVGAMVK